MPVNTISVGAAVTPTVIETYVSHYLNRRPLRQKPTAHISYHEGLELIRRFLQFASLNTVEELQAFTAQWVPVPTWVHVKEVEIGQGQLSRAAEYIRAQLGPAGVQAVGGKSWWEWRREGARLKAEWIEMRKDAEERKKSSNTKGQRVMLYVHGGAYFFGSVDEHRYQMQRHARKLKARVLAPRYRLAPQFPFPCGLMDCLASYLFLLEQGHHPNTILLAGDSAGGGMVMSILVTLRDQGVPLPAGAILISPWVDLTHSFPSLGGDGKMDYIPAHGFVHKPSMSWPPPNADDLCQLGQKSPTTQQDEKRSPRISLSRSSREARSAHKEEKAERVRGFSVKSTDRPDTNELLKPPGATPDTFVNSDGKYSIGPDGMLSVKLDGTLVEIKDQIQLYAANHLLTHPLVSPALQPTLGGLPPLLIQVGGGELLRDEQIYLAHKAAQPLAYVPPPSNNQTAEAIQAQVAKYRPTNVQLQLWDDLCHVAPTLSFTRPAKHMYRSIAQFGAWALARAQKTGIDILDDDSISFVSTDSSASGSSESDSNPSPDDIKLNMPQSAQHVGFESVTTKEEKGSKVGKAGDALPAFESHMIRQRIDRHGHIHVLPPKKDLEALNISSVEIGVPKPGPVNKWMKAQKQWNGKFAKQKLKIQKKRIKEMEKGYEDFEGEHPPPTALAGRRVKGMKGEKKAKRSWGMSLWSLWGSKHDEATLVREEKADEEPAEDPSATTQKPNEPPAETADSKPVRSKSHSKARRRTFSRNRSGLAAGPTNATARSRSRSRHANVTYQGQMGQSAEDLTNIAPPTPGLAEATVIAPERKASPLPSPMSEPSSAKFSTDAAPDITVTAEGDDGANTPPIMIPATDTTSTRPTKGIVAYPFRLKVDGTDGKDVNASTLTLHSISVASPSLEEFKEGEKGLGAPPPAGAAAEPTERPAMERFVTAGGGDLDTSSPLRENENEKKSTEAQRPGMDRFETAQEDLNTLASGAITAEKS